jgi:hypothetical protein
MHGQYSFTTVDISKKQDPQVVNHAPGNRDHRLVFFASPVKLLVVQDNRMTASTSLPID